MNIEMLMDFVETWLTTGDLNSEILSDSFTFSSPFWNKANKNEFLSKFLDPGEYIEKSLKNIIKFDPIIRCISYSQQYFTLVLRYHTKNGTSVDEVVLCEIKNNLLFSMKSIYDLSLTKKAHNL